MVVLTKQLVPLQVDHSDEVHGLYLYKGRTFALQPDTIPYIAHPPLINQDIVGKCEQTACTLDNKERMRYQKSLSVSAVTIVGVKL